MSRGSWPVIRRRTSAGTVADCTERGCWSCRYDAAAQARRCVDGGSHCGEGRPFIVDGTARTASAIRTSSWLHSVAPSPPLSSRQRETLAAHWRDAALAEHASIAAFARFSLELLALGAPPTLLDASMRAMQDEIRHARDCFALASRYAGHPVGPGPLRTDGAVPSAVDLVSVATSVVREACVGETLAAIVASAAALRASDPRVRGVLEGVADDELRHAELGWQFLRWALDRANPPQRAAILSELRAATLAPPQSSESAIDPALSAHGHLDTHTLAQLHDAATEHVLLPAAQALFKGRIGDTLSPQGRLSASRCSTETLCRQNPG